MLLRSLLHPSAAYGPSVSLRDPHQEVNLHQRSLKTGTLQSGPWKIILNSSGEGHSQREAAGFDKYTEPILRKKKKERKRKPRGRAIRGQTFAHSDNDIRNIEETR